MNVREETVGRYDKERLLDVVKGELNRLEIPYAAEPGGLGRTPLLDPGDFY